MTNTNTNTNTSITFDFTKITLEDAIEVINDNLDSITGTILTDCINTIKEQLKIENKARKAEKIGELVDYAERVDVLMDDYINNPFYTVQILKQDKATKEYKLVNSIKMLDFLSLDNAYRKEHKKHVCFDSDFWLKNCKLSRDIIAYATRNINDTQKVSITGMEKSLNELVIALMGENAPKMLKADVKALVAACVKSKFMQFTAITEKAMLNNIILAIRTRKANAKYTIKTNYKYSENGEKVNKKADK